MKIRYSILTSIGLLCLSACSEKPAADGAVAAPDAEKPAVEAQADAAPVPPAPAAVDRGNVDFVEIPLDGTSNKSHVVAAGQSLSGGFASPKAGAVVGVEVQVGNYANSSVGMLNVKLCQSEVCAAGRADLANSKDNEYFYIALEKPLQLAAEGAVAYTFTRESGENDFALWSYPASVSTSTLSLSGAAVESRTLKLGLRYSR